MSTSDHNPEILRPGFETDGEQSELDDLIRGMSELADATGRVSGTQFASDTLEEMKARGIDVNPYSMSIVLRHAFGDPEELLSRMQGKTADELDEMLPGEVGDFAFDYLKPVLGGSTEA